MSQEISGHTKGKWTVNEPHAARSHSRQVLDGSGNVVAECQEWNTGTGRCADANAQFIVRACNAHDDMLAALEGARPFIEEIARERGNGVGDQASIVLDRLNAAIAKAGA